MVDEEGLQENARTVGNQLLDGFRVLKEKHPVFGDVRGVGLFLGVELVTDRKTKEPATGIANYVMNRLRDHRVLIGREGPFDNILKIRPPLTITPDDAGLILDLMDQIFSETPCAVQ